MVTDPQGLLEAFKNIINITILFAFISAFVGAWWAMLVLGLVLILGGLTVLIPNINK